MVSDLLDFFQMNVLVLSDYGITDLDMTTDINISNYINMDDVQYLIYSSHYNLYIFG